MGALGYPAALVRWSALVAILFAGAPCSARAESSLVNAHIDVGPAFPLLGDLQEARGGEYDGPGYAASVGIDIQPSSAAHSSEIGVALLARYHFAYFPSYPITPLVKDGVFDHAVSIGALVRAIDDRRGYLAQAGNLLGHFGAELNVTWHRLFDAPRVGLDVASYYVFSFASPAQI